MKEKTANWLEKYLPEWKQAGYLLAVSGGRDSVLLADLFHRLSLTFEIAHVNFQLREGESDGDESFVRELAQHYSVPFHLKRVDTVLYASQNGLSIQMAAREIRYNWFEELRQQQNLTYVAVGTHRSDEVETILINQLRGTGLAGLHGILPVRGPIIRPLIECTRTEIDQYLQQNPIAYREDSSNSNDRYLRNHIRHHLMPEILRIDRKAEQIMAKNAERIRAAEQIYRTEIDRQRQALVSQEQEQWRIEIGGLQKLSSPALYLYEFIAEFGFSHTQCEDLVNAFDSESGKQFFSTTHVLNKDRAYLLLEKRNTKDLGPVLIESDQKHLTHPIKLHLSLMNPVPHPIPGSASAAYLDFNQLEFPLTLRRWQPGDSFIPLGMNGQKKVSDFLIDNKVSLIEKERTFILQSGSDIVWVVGHRIDHRYRLRPDSKSAFVITKHED